VGLFFALSKFLKFNKTNNTLYFIFDHILSFVRSENEKSIPMQEANGSYVFAVWPTRGLLVEKLVVKFLVSSGKMPLYLKTIMPFLLPNSYLGG